MPTETDPIPPTELPAPDEAATDTRLVRREVIDLPVSAPGTQRRMHVLRFGRPGARPKAYLQAGLHADELPGMVTLRELAAKLEEVAAQGGILGEIVLVPVANPIGLAQQSFGYLSGRHDMRSAGNFNRGYPALGPEIAEAVAGQLGPDPIANVAAIRAAMTVALAAHNPLSEVDVLRLRLLELAHDADIVLDLHSDNEALMHLYTGTPLWPDAEDLAAEIDARAILLCEESGGNPFDEACSAPWWHLAAAFPAFPILAACLAATVELRSNNEVEAGHIASDAGALFRFLTRRGLIAGDAGPLPRLLATAVPLTAMQQVTAPAAGVVVYHARLGDSLRHGDAVASIVDPLGGSVEVTARTDGILFARHDQPYAWPGKIIGKIAGSQPLAERQGHLLTD